MSNFATNNKHADCPPRMSDGRHFTDYSPVCDSNDKFRKDNNLKSSFEQRMYLIRNASKIMENNKKYIEQKNGCKDCMKPYNVGTMLPESTMVKCNKESCDVEVVDITGLGQGRQYKTI